MTTKDYKCKLLPFIRTDAISIQECQQKVGWNITAFDLPKIWEHTKGEGVKVAVLDTGCDLTHEDLKDNLLPGMNFVNVGRPPMDGCGHGTHVTGILVAENNSIGMVGVSPGAKVIPVKVLDDHGSGNLINVSKGIRWAADNGADILQMSLGAPQKVQEVRKAIQYAASKGIPTFVAAGNAGRSELFYPAAYPETISVGAIGVDMHRAKFSNIAEALDFMAPGVDIFSTVPTNWYATMSGTSMACPFAVGVAALWLSYARSKNCPPKTVDDFRKALRQYTIPLTDENLKDKKFYEGFGIIDPRKLDASIQVT